MSKLKGLVKENMFNGFSREKQAENFDWEEAAYLAVDTLRMTLMRGNDKEICKYVGAITALGIEFEDLDFVTETDQMKIFNALKGVI